MAHTSGPFFSTSQRGMRLLLLRLAASLPHGRPRGSFFLFPPRDRPRASYTRCLSFVYFLSGRGAHNEMREEDGDTSFGRSVERRATLTKGNTICTPSREAQFPALFRTHARPPSQCTPVAVAVRNDARFSWKFVCRSLSDARFRHFAFDYPDFRLDRLRRKID